jgi:hypothetical protein
MSKKPFHLHVVPSEQGLYGVELYQDQFKNGNGMERVLVSKLDGPPLQSVTDRVLEALKKDGYRSVDLSRGRNAPFDLDEETGVRLGLVFAAVKPLRKLARIETISSSVNAMAAEEAYYWFAKCTSGENSRRAQKSLRILLAEE